MDEHLLATELVPGIDERLGFRVVDSVVVLLMADRQVLVAARLDCDQVRIAPNLDQLAAVAQRCSATEYAAVVVDPLDPRLFELLDHPEFGLPGLLRVWTATIDRDRWASRVCSAECDHQLPLRSNLTRDTVVASLGPDRAERAKVAAVLRRGVAVAEPQHTVAAFTRPVPLTPGQIASALRLLSHVPSRDRVIWDLSALAACDAGVWPLAFTKLVAVMRAAPHPHAADAAAVAALAAWQAGDGMRAGVCVRTALDEDPEHRLASLLERVITAGLLPQIWQRALAAGPGLRTVGL